MVDVTRPEFVPDASLSRAEMETLQRDIAEVAVFEDDHGFSPSAVSIGKSVDLKEGVPEAYAPEALLDHDADAPIVVGVDQSFLDDRALSALVAIQDGSVIERTYAVTPLEIPYIPGLLSFREGKPILDAFATLSVDPDLVLFDGSGRIHFRQAGIATHIGVVLDVPSIGVAKSLLCGTPDDDPNGRPEGWSTPIRADGRVDAPEGTVIGHAFQSRQYESSRRVNPLYISPGHRVSAETTLALVDQLCAGYKLPQPTRLADAYAEEAKTLL